MQPLYRAEAVAHATQRLDGEVLLPAPLVTWGAVGFAMAVLALGAWFLASASYAPTESAEGWLAPAGGVARAVSRRDGNVLALMVAEGDVVEAGMPLARVGSPARFGNGRQSLTFDPSPPNEGTDPGSAWEDAANGSEPDADTQAMPPEFAVQAVVARAVDALLRDLAEHARHGPYGLSVESVATDGGHIVTAPISGRVEALVVREGEFVPRGGSIALIAASDELIAEIVVPSHVAGLVTSGQGLRLKYEGLPFGYQGVQHGIVMHVSRTLAPDDPERLAVSVTGPLYRAQIRLPAQEVDVGGASIGLRAGMRVAAEIPAPRRTVLQTLYETIR